MQFTCKVRLHLGFFCLLVCMNCGKAFSDDGFVALFDGKTLNGWSAPDMRYWSVRDGAITAESSEQLPCKQNQFLVLKDNKEKKERIMK